MTKETRLKSRFASARAFFRSFELKHHHRKRTSSPVNACPPSLCSSSSNDDQQLITKIEPINPRDLIVHRVRDIDDKLPLNYFQQKYKQYLKPSLLFPRQYYNELLHKRTYSSLNSRYSEVKEKSIIDFHLPAATITNEYRALHYPEIKPLHSPSSSSSMFTWNQCVRRLNTEYRLTLDALEQAKECLKQTYGAPKTRLPAKKSVSFTLCLPSLPIRDRIEESKILPGLQFAQPKFIKPVQLETFPLAAELTIVENEEKIDSISDIIKRFNSFSSSSPQSVRGDDDHHHPRVHFQPSVTTYDIPEEEPVQHIQLMAKPSKKFISRIPTKVNGSNKLIKPSIVTTTAIKNGHIRSQIPIRTSRVSRK